MPIYIYECEDCESIFEIQHSMNEKQKNCINCGSESIIKLINTLSNNIDKSKPETKVGKVVKNYIEDLKDEIHEYRKQLNDDNKEYKI